MSNSSSDTSSNAAKPDYGGSGHNKDGNHWCNRDGGAGNDYHYSNRDGSYYYSNKDGSKYYNSGDGFAKYTSPDGKSRTTDNRK
ncbi:hypothetical protein GYMLUDRAFT_39495 [Collybiopsis luxurians FD-317 M1]|nr:hypothetical protein GYMLUDRAFT_39495 [Collybiopsis luxurians FD-317 M1]